MLTYAMKPVVLTNNPYPEAPMNSPIRPLTFFSWAFALWAFSFPSALAQNLEPWQRIALDELAQRYVTPGSAADLQDQHAKLEATLRAMGERLAVGGSGAVSTKDLALITLLRVELSREEDTSVAAASTGTQSATSPAQGQASVPVTTYPPSTRSGAAEQRQIADLGRGLEGIRQAQDALAEMPVGQRLVITGDVVSALQAATVPGNADLTTAVGRARVNFTLRAFSGGGVRGLSDGYFFVQMRAAGGAADSSVVGGPNSFSRFNGIAADRSAFNEGTSRGNLYLSKAFYEQNLDLPNGTINGRIGIINLSDFFDTNSFANNEARQFINEGFINSAGFKTGISAPGLMGQYFREIGKGKLRQMIFRAGYAMSQTNRAFTSPLWAGEVEGVTEFFGREGHYRVGGSAGNVADQGGITGVHFSADQWLTNSIGVFGRYAWNNSGRGSLAFGPVSQSYSGGIQKRFIDAGDHVSAFSVGFSQAFPIASEPGLVSEKALETYYRWQWTRNVSLTPDFQLIFGSGGRRQQGTQAVMSVRLNFGF